MASRAHSSQHSQLNEDDSNEEDLMDFSSGSSDDYHPSSDSDIGESGKIIMFITKKLH